MAECRREPIGDAQCARREVDARSVRRLVGHEPPDAQRELRHRPGVVCAARRRGNGRQDAERHRAQRRVAGAPGVVGARQRVGDRSKQLGDQAGGDQQTVLDLRRKCVPGPELREGRPQQLDGTAHIAVEDLRAGQLDRNRGPGLAIGGERAGAAQVLQGAGLPGAGLSRPQLEQQPGSLGRRRRLLQCAAEIRGGHLRRPAADRDRGGAPQGAGHPPIRRGLGGQQVRHDALRGVAVVRQQLCGAPVVSREAGRGDRGVDRAPYRRVYELQRPVRSEDVRTAERVGSVGGGGQVEPGQPCGRSQLGVRAEDGDRRGQLRGVLPEPPQA
jgi:hypothetical protein